MSESEQQGQSSTKKEWSIKEITKTGIPLVWAEHERDGIKQLPEWHIPGDGTAFHERNSDGQHAPHVHPSIAVLAALSWKEKGGYRNQQIFVQHVAGYGVDAIELDRRVTLLTKAGFSRLRSEPGANGKYWEIWYLPSEHSAAGPIANMNMDQIVNWIVRNIRPGEITFNATHLGLSPE